MALERKDVRVRVDSDMHAMLAAVADADGKEMAEWCEQFIVAELMRRVRAATMIAKAAERNSIKWSAPE